MGDLVKRLNELCDAAPFQASWYLKDFATGGSADRRGDVPVPSASTRKISIMMAALAAVHAGKLALDQKVTIDARYQANDSGTFQHLTPGFWITLRDTLVMMIIVSDNTCTGTVVDLVGLENVRRYCESVRLTGTVHRYGIPPKIGPDNSLDRVTTTTPNDQGLLLELILRGIDDAAVATRRQCTAALCRLGLDILSSQKLKTRLPSLLPLSTKGAHKIGRALQPPLPDAEPALSVRDHAEKGRAALPARRGRHGPHAGAGVRSRSLRGGHDAGGGQVRPR